MVKGREVMGRPGTWDEAHTGRDGELGIHTGTGWDFESLAMVQIVGEGGKP